jgi:hypothetical protein
MVCPYFSLPRSISHIQRYCLQAVIEHELKTQTQPLLALMVCPYFSPAFLLCSYFHYQFFAYFGDFPLENTPSKRYFNM